MQRAELYFQLNALRRQANQFLDELAEYERQERNQVPGLRLDEAAMIEVLSTTTESLNRVSDLFTLAQPKPKPLGPKPV